MNEKWPGPHTLAPSYSSVTLTSIPGGTMRAPTGHYGTFSGAHP